MKKILYANMGGTEAADLSARDIQLLSRRSFLKRGTLFLPLAFVAGAAAIVGTSKARAASTIINRTISAASQNAIHMANSTWARPVAFPSTWNVIRVGCRMRLLPSWKRYVWSVQVSWPRASRTAP